MLESYALTNSVHHTHSWQVPRVLATMTAQAFLHHTGSTRSDALGDVRDAETLRDLVIDLRMEHYQRSLGQKMKAWNAVAGNVTYGRVAGLNSVEFDLFIGTHAHGFSRAEFWALVRAMQVDTDKETAFLAKANREFAGWWTANKGANWCKGHRCR